MPDANGGRGISLQCLNQHRGPQDDTYLAKDLPDYICHHLRVQPLGAGWGIAGYSEGGFCAANLGLQHGSIFNDAAVLSGYFRPDLNQLINPPRRVSAFASQKQDRANTPLTCSGRCRSAGPFRSSGSARATATRRTCTPRRTSASCSSSASPT